MSLLTSIGIGNAKVDLILPDPTAEAGGTLEGRVEVDGGTDTQEVEDIYAALRTHYLTPEGHHQTTIQEYELTGAFTIRPDEHKEFDVELSIPVSTPVTRGKTTVWIDTGLDIEWAADPDDKDEVTVRPNPQVEAIMDALKRLSFETEAHEPVATVGTPLSGHGQYAQELTLHMEGYERPVYLTYTVDEDGDLLFGLHQDEERAGHRDIGRYAVHDPDPKVVADDIERLLAKDHTKSD